MNFSDNIENLFFIIAIIIISIIALYIITTIKLDVKKINKWLVLSNPNKEYSLQELADMGNNNFLQ
jgi:hypothetical protein